MMNRQRYSPKIGVEYPSGIVCPDKLREQRNYGGGPNCNYGWADAKAELEAIYEDVLQRTTNQIPMDTVNDIVKIAIYLFGGKQFYPIMDYQHDNGNFQGDKRRFAIDTLKFIQTGQRDMSITTWMRYLSVQEETYTSELRGAIKEPSMIDAVKEYRVGVKNPYTQWLSHEGGLMDMLHSMFILFSQTGRTNEVAY